MTLKEEEDEEEEAEERGIYICLFTQTKRPRPRGSEQCQEPLHLSMYGLTPYGEGAFDSEIDD